MFTHLLHYRPGFFVIFLLRILKKQKMNVADLHREDGPFAGYNPCALLTMLIGAGAAFINELTWIIGVVVAGIAYIILMKFAFKGSRFKKGKIFENEF